MPRRGRARPSPARVGPAAPAAPGRGLPRATGRGSLPRAFRRRAARDWHRARSRPCVATAVHGRPPGSRPRGAPRLGLPVEFSRRRPPRKMPPGVPSPPGAPGCRRTPPVPPSPPTDPAAAPRRRPARRQDPVKGTECVPG